MRYAYDKFTTPVVSCKSNLQLPYDCRVRHEECRGLLKHVLKTYHNRSDWQFYIEQIDHLHYDVIRAKPDGSCSRPAETGPSFPGGKASGQY